MQPNESPFVSNAELVEAFEEAIANLDRSESPAVRVLRKLILSRMDMFVGYCHAPPLGADLKRQLVDGSLFGSRRIHVAEAPKTVGDDWEPRVSLPPDVNGAQDHQPTDDTPAPYHGPIPRPSVTKSVLPQPSPVPQDPAVAVEEDPEPAPRTQSERLDHQRIKATEYIVRNGRSTRSDLMKELEVGDGALNRILNHKWFEKEGGRVNVTNEARQAVMGERLD